MIKLDKPKRNIELEILEAEIELAVLKYENEKWVHQHSLKVKGVSPDG